MVKERQSNIELLRIVATLLILVVHANYWRIGVPMHAEAIASPLPTFTRILIQHLASICVNAFIIISGYFAIRPKLKSIANLWFLLAFWGGVSVLVDGGTFRSCAFRICFPFLGWFIPAYLGLYLISPLLNQYVEHSNGRTIARYIILFFLLQTIFDLVLIHGDSGWAISGRSVFNHGYSILSFVPLYLLGRYLMLYRPGWIRKSFRFWFSMYFILFNLSSLVFFIIRYFLPSVESYSAVSDCINRCFSSYTSPFCIVGSLFFFLAFDSLAFTSRIVNRISMSALAVFCFHSMGFYAPTVKNIYENNSGALVLLLDGSFIIAVYVVGTIIDQIRIFIWKKGSNYVFK